MAELMENRALGAQPLIAADLWRNSVGHGFPTLVMHGGMGLDHSYFTPALDPLADCLNLIYYDHRGSGRSPEPPDWNSVSEQSWVNDADALRRQLGHGRVIVFGHSYGGIVALEYALRFPERVAGLILCSSFAAFDFGELAFARLSQRATASQIEALAAGLSSPFSDDQSFRAFAELIFPFSFHQPTESNLRAVASVLLRAAAYNHSVFTCLPKFSALARLQHVSVPTLIMGGADDWSCPVEHSIARLHQGIGGSEMVVFEKSGHFPFVEQQDEFILSVRDWLARVRPSMANGEREHMT
jgi:proline iminopeptidase